LNVSKDWVSWAPKKGVEPTEGLLKACGIFEWIENNLKIRIKKKREYVDKDGNRRRTQLVKFRFNAIQFILAEFVADRWSKGLPVKAFTPKARQLGSSTFWQALMFALAVLSPGFQVLTVAHTEESGTEIFGKTRTFEKHLPAGWLQQLETRQRSRIDWENGSGSWVGAASEGDGLSKGPTLNAIHFSEVASFADRGQDPMLPVTSARGALAEGPECIEIHESTAQGRDVFFFHGCEEAKDPNSDSEFALIFLPWFLDPDYKMSWASYRQRLISAGKNDPGEKFVPTSEELILRRQLAETIVRKGEELWRWRHVLTDDQLVWRRWAIKNKCGGKVELFQRYFPSFYEEAFASTVRCLFSEETIDWYRRRSKDAMAVGNVVRADPYVAFHSKRGGALKLWEEPLSGEKYVIGADPGGQRKGADFNAAYVLKSRTLEVVAAIHSHMEWDHFTEYLALVGEWYNWALLVVERNHNPAIASTLAKEYQYPNLYYYVDEAALRGQPKIPGFSTNRTTRPQLVSHIDRVTRDRLLKCPDLGFATEMVDFTWNEKEKRYRAHGKAKDDRVMALALGLFRCEARDQREVEVEEEKSWAYRRFLEVQAEARSNEGPSGVLIL
jgi:hypothetical protein